MVADGDPDFHNAATVSEREALSFERVYQEWQHTHEQLKIAIRDLPPEKMEAQYRLPLGADRKHRRSGHWPHHRTRSEPYARYSSTSSEKINR